MFLNSKIRFDGSYAVNFKSRIIHTLFTPLRILFPNDHYYKKYLKFVSKYDYDKSEYITYPSTYFTYDFIFKKTLFEPVSSMKFEDVEVNVPHDPDKVLKQMFGDYMKLPPVEKRVFQYTADYINFNESYTKLSSI